jgi:hypothetical protein
MRSNVVPIASRRATAEKVADFGEPLLEDDVSFESLPPSALAAPPVASPQPGVLGQGSVAAHADGSPSAAQASAALSAQHVAAAVPSREVEPPKSSEFGRSRVSSRAPSARRSNPALWVVLILAGMLGGVGLDLLIPKLRKAPEVQIVSVMVPAPPPPASAATREEEGTTSVGPIELVAAPTRGGGKAPKPAPADSAAGSAAIPLGPSLTGLNGLVTGPSGPSGGAAQGAAGGQLAAADVERVVQAHRAFVKRQCWDNALSTRSSGAPSSAKVVVSINVARDGTVQSASANGGEAYPGLASCVQGNVKGWKFPSSEGAIVNVPFVFAAQ